MEDSHEEDLWGIEWTEKTAYIGTLRDDGKIKELVTKIDIDPNLNPHSLERNKARARLLAAAPAMLAGLDPEALFKIAKNIEKQFYPEAAMLALMASIQQDAICDLRGEVNKNP